VVTNDINHRQIDVVCDHFPISGRSLSACAIWKL
jgi:hypothetical protein